MGRIVAYKQLLKALFVLSVIAMISGCHSGTEIPDNRIVLDLWKHDVGDREEAANEAMFERFNQSQDKYYVDYISVPQGSYSDALTVAALAGDMPCLVVVDSPLVANFVWAEFLRPLDEIVSPETFEAVSPAAMGTYQSKIYSVGQFDAALALFTRRSTLDKFGIRIPTLDNPWSQAEFDNILHTLKESGEWRYPLDLQTRDDSSNWWTYAYLPLLQSFGGNILNPNDAKTAEGYLNGDASIAFANWFQSLFEKGYVNRREPEDRSLLKGRSAIVYTGNWWEKDFASALGDDLLILPPPDLGHGTVIGGGSWQWAVSRKCEQAEGAAAFIEFAMQDNEIAALADAAAMVPVTDAASQMTTKYRDDGSSRVFFDLMNRFAQPRPATPAFVTVKNAFTGAMQDIMNGADVRDSLDDAVDDIERVIEENNGYATGAEGSK